MCGSDHKSNVCERRVRRLSSWRFILAPLSLLFFRCSMMMVQYPSIKLPAAVKLLQNLLVGHWDVALVWWVFFLTCSSALILLFECCLYGSDGRRPAHELPVLWSDLRHRRRRSDHHRPHCSSGEGKSCVVLCCVVLNNSPKLFDIDKNSQWLLLLKGL